VRVLFVVRSLDVGGAQRQLVATARGLGARHDVSVAVFYGGGLFEDDVRAAGIPIHDLGRRSRLESLPFMTRMARLVWQVRPDVIYAYMGGANLFSAALKPVLPKVKVVWGVRDALQRLSSYGWLTVVGDRLERIIAPVTDALIANSQAARRQCIARGLDERKVMVIPNGTDCAVFRRDDDEGRRFRADIGVPEEAPVVGVVARLDPVKGHETFIRAAAVVARAEPEARFVCVGDGRPEYRAQLERLVASVRLADRFVWAGERRVTRAVYSAFDVGVLSSNVGESFPNVVTEAMACGVPCAVTDSGDMPLIVGATGAVVPIGDATALAPAIADLLARARAPASTARALARARIEHEFSVPVLVSRTEAALEAVLRLEPRLFPRGAEGALPFTGGVG
jgi:glycosyltransferase involved in cell wall biosynthesis